jgi:energy-converting hydrogenase Eha subunit C
MPDTSSGVGFALWKFGAIKLFGLGAALIGACIMAVFRPPKTRKELFAQCAVALASSLLFGGTAVIAIAKYTDWIVLSTAPIDELIQFSCMVHGLIGALSWGLFGGIAVLRDKFGSDPIQAVKDVKDRL